MHKILIALFLISLIPSFSLSQVIEGKIIDLESREPIKNANIFLAGTLIGTTTDKLGDFLLDTKGNTSNPMIISFVGYESKILSRDFKKKNSIITLKRKNKEISEVTVNAIPSTWSRKKMLRVFKKEFLGTSRNAKSCKILNETDIYLFYNDSTGLLHGHSKKPLIILNRMLGYKIFYSLENFKYSENKTSFKGYHRFEELEPEVKSLFERIKKKREETYYGSIMHLMRHLYNDKIHENDTIYKFRMASKNSYYIEEEIKIISETTPLRHYDPANMDTVKARLHTDFGLEKIFENFHLYDTTFNYLTTRRIIFEEGDSRKLCYPDKIRIIYFPKNMKSFLIPRADSIEIAKNGYYNPDLITWHGSMSKYRVGDMLPFSYNPEGSD